jgi:hypothetical protein
VNAGASSASSNPRAAVPAHLLELKMSDENGRPQTFGEKAVGLSFNPSKDDLVHAVKLRFAELIDEMNALRLRTASPEVKRLASLAITEAQGAQMWAVKAVTWKD